jgi:hypothetical protein
MLLPIHTRGKNPGGWMGSEEKLKILNYIVLQHMSNIRKDCHSYCSEKREVLNTKVS